jgi:hypothetical protein
MSELCSELGIILISQHSNTFRLLQLLNAATFKPLKMGRKTAGQDWHKQNPDKILNKERFSPVLDGALKNYSLECSRKQGIPVCGLQP